MVLGLKHQIGLPKYFYSPDSFRFGHSQINAKVLRFDKNRKASRYGHLLLREGFFRPERVTKEGGIAQIFRGAVRQPAQQIDAKVVDELRNFLFANRGNSLDLVAINLQRGRETGIPDYNTVREALGLKRKISLFFRYFLAYLKHRMKVLHALLQQTPSKQDVVFFPFWLMPSSLVPVCPFHPNPAPSKQHAVNTVYTTVMFPLSII